MANIGIDIDETLYSFDSAVRNAFFDMAEEYDDKSILRMAYSNNHEWRNLVDHDKKIAYEAIDRVHRNTMAYDLFEGVDRVLWKLDQHQHNIKYVGMRKPEYKRITEMWISAHGLPEGEVICSEPSRGSKMDDVSDCQYLIDDRPKTIIEFLYDKFWGGPQRKAFALWRPYNQNLTEIKNLYLAPTWRGLEYYLNRKGVI